MWSSYITLLPMRLEIESLMVRINLSASTILFSMIFMFESVSFWSKILMSFDRVLEEFAKDDVIFDDREFPSIF